MKRTLTLIAAALAFAACSYKWLIGITLVLTLVGSLMAQVNAVVLDRAVDAINALIQQPTFEWSSALRILTTISIITSPPSASTFLLLLLLLVVVIVPIVVAVFVIVVAVSTTASTITATSSCRRPPVAS